MNEQAPFPYRCKFCGAPGTIYVDHVESAMDACRRWLPMACCNRCGDFYSLKAIRQDRIRKVCLAWQQLKQINTAELEKQEAFIRQKLSKLTQAFADHICRHVGVAVLWEPTFVEGLLENPDRSGEICGEYVRMVMRLTKSQGREFS